MENRAKQREGMTAVQFTDYSYFSHDLAVICRYHTIGSREEQTRLPDYQTRQPIPLQTPFANTQHTPKKPRPSAGVFWAFWETGRTQSCNPERKGI